MKKKIGILGSGMVAQTLGNGFLKHGYSVMLGTRDASKLNEWQEKQPKGNVGSFSETGAFGEIVVLAVSGKFAQDALQLAGKDALKGKTIIDATNPIENAPPENGVIKFFTSLNESLMEILQKASPEANFVKAFNSVGNALMVNPEFETTPTMFICGNNEQAKKETSEILTTFGYETADFGGVESARAIEPLCILWCIPGMLRQEWSHAFKLLKK
jgi:predicted dinucleotide-binding enzyme